MKHLEEIEHLSISELERIASDSTIEVPEELDTKVLSAIVASDSGLMAHFTGKRAAFSHNRRLRIWNKALAVTVTGIAACLAIIFLWPNNPKDTFDDPKLAYEELEKAVSLISSKMERGLELASGITPAIEVTDRIINQKTK